ncbi:hypothetical protein [Marinibacterium profundimaris]|uniref:Cation/multidrug efflux pump n=1 Tax=Marinibacterium profundimaris TaxID=1679460 RepID=A0A225NN79_9RHOB|nr:hypothetical protein [Marinibacterium profundimaris]OWU75974.1 hypothetical protein ATO3_07310 [Marinibacterium profundimaris]
MISLLRMLIPLLIILSLVYAVAAFRARARARDRLEEEWEEEGMTGDRDAFIEDGLEDYAGSFRRKMLLAIYVVPLCLIALMVYLTNYS